MDENGLPIKFLIDGIDRLGKSTLISRIQEELGYHLVIHYDKPKVLANYLDMADCIKRAEVSETDYDESYRQLSLENLARRLYQEDANRGMFDLLKNDTPIIFDRTHLGELVYAPLYRKYSGEYVYDMERDLVESRPFSMESTVRLILLTSSNTEMLQDDGLGFDFSKKAEEQELFIQAFNKSNIVNKVIVDVHNGTGGYKTYEEVFQEAIYKAHK
jgi:thymidylate kinase